MTSPNPFTSTQHGTTGTGGILNSGAGVVTANPLGNSRQTSSNSTLNPPAMGTLVYAPNVQIIIASSGIESDISTDIVRGQVVRKENSCSSLFVTLANPQLRYNHAFARMDRIACFLTRVAPLQVFAGYLDTIPYYQAYPGTIDLRATCTLKRLLHTWWNPASPAAQTLIGSLGAELGLQGDGQGGAVTGTGVGGVLEQILEQVGSWSPNTVHVQNFPQEMVTFLNTYMQETNMQARNQDLANQFNANILGDYEAPGPTGAVGYQGSDPLGSPASATNIGITFYLQQIIAAVDSRGMGPVVDATADSQTVSQDANIFESVPVSDPQTAPSIAAIHEAGQQDAQYASNWSTQNTDSDAAILALACAMVESGSGTEAILMMANPADPPTETFYYQALRTTGTGSGLFNQANNGQWGTPAQRMNPYASAGMFLDALNAQTGWRNMDPGQAIWQVQQNDPTFVAMYDAVITQAQSLVEAYRTSTGTGTSTSSILGQVPGAGSISSVLGGNALGGSAGSILGAAATSPVSTAAGAAQLDAPNPNSEGAINAAMTISGTSNVSTQGVGVNTSPQLVQLAFGAIGVALPPTVDAQRNFIPPIPLTSQARGDVLQSNYGAQTGISLGNGTWITVPGGTTAIPATGGDGLMWAGRVCANGGTNPSAPFSPINLVAGTVAGGSTPYVAGTGLAPGQGTSGSDGSTSGGTQGNEPIARNLFAYAFEPANYATIASTYFTGERAYIDDIPLFQTVLAFCTASLRNFQSAPNGDFIAYYPDPFGLDGKAAILSLEDIELKDLHIDLSDDNLTTHVYIEGDYTMMGQADQVSGWLQTCGVATVQNQTLFQRMISVAPADITGNMSALQLMYTFGVRPYKDSFQMAGNSGLEFLLAVQIFMGKWASQYQTDIGLTFMPELFPGMRVMMAGHNLTVYCSAVTHEFDWERGFSTTATVSAASNAQAATTVLGSLPGLNGLNLFSTNPGSNTNTFGQQVNPGLTSPLAGGIFSQPGASTSPSGVGAVPVTTGG